jgi:DoxX-like family
MNQLFPARQSRARSIVYWMSTALLAFGLLLGGASDVMRAQPIREGMAHLGYPSYFPVIIGVWKLLGAVVILAPRLGRLKEWAYAGTFFNMSGAVISHMAVGDTFGQIAPSLMFSVLTLVSWATRPPTRRLGGDLAVQA